VIRQTGALPPETAAGSLAHAVTGGPLLLASAVAMLVGVVGFLSPCVLPLVPGYLAYISRLAGTEGPRPRRVVAGAFLFVLGFSLVLVSGGLIFGRFGETLRLHATVANRVFGAVTILFGLAFLGRVSFLQREFRFHRLPAAGLLGAPLLGAAFGFSWGPCLTPTFSAVYFMSQYTQSAGSGAFLTASYCVGIGIPFILFACGFGWVARSTAFFRRRAAWVTVFGGVLLIGMGLLMITERWQHWMNLLRAGAGAGGFDI
jgi:cytochrome c-type biogenesis protein